MTALQKPNYLKLIGFFGSLALAFGLFATVSTKAENPTAPKDIFAQRSLLRSELGHSLLGNNLPNQMTMDWGNGPKNLSIQYTIDSNLQNEANSLLRSYKPDYGAIFMIDAQTGKVLAMSSYQRDNSSAANLNLKATYPVASVFKVVTATTAIDKAGIEPDHQIAFNGGNYTLYKKNVLSDKVTKWTRYITLKDAFARSINTAFGRLSLEALHPEDIGQYAKRFMFNQAIPTDLPVDPGVAFVPEESGFALAEVVSGYNKANRMSPLQGAMIAAAVANDGRLVAPYIVDEVKDKNEVIYHGQTLELDPVMRKESALKVREMMEQTITAGTSRKSFRTLIHDKKFREVEMGGKTGHLNGDNPKGRVDWFVGYALDGNRKIAIAAITVNRKYWTVKSSYLGQTMFRKFFTPFLTNQLVSQNGSLRSASRR